MALRLIEVTLPAGELGRAEELVSELDVVEVRGRELADGLGLLRVLLRSERTEAVTDALSKAFQNAEGFRLLLFPVEATLPRPEAPREKEETTPQEERSPERVSREELYEDVASGAKLSPVFLVTVGLSTMVAAVGLLRSDIAIVIGAMVIAPLLGPNVALSLASTLGDSTLAVKAIKTNVVGVSVALALSIALGLVLPVDPEVPAIATRTRAGLSDVALALASGSAGALAFTSGLPTAVVGVMVSVALLPPLVVGGLLLGAGRPSLALGALLLVLTNVTCVNLAGVATFLAQRIRPRTWWDVERARQATRLAIASWLVMLAILVASILLLQPRWLPLP